MGLGESPTAHHLLPYCPLCRGERCSPRSHDGSENLHQKADYSSFVALSAMVGNSGLTAGV